MATMWIPRYKCRSCIGTRWTRPGVGWWGGRGVSRVKKSELWGILIPRRPRLLIPVMRRCVHLCNTFNLCALCNTFNLCAFVQYFQLVCIVQYFFLVWIVWIAQFPLQTFISFKSQLSWVPSWQTLAEHQSVFREKKIFNLLNFSTEYN